MLAKLIDQYDSSMTKLTEFYRQRAKIHWATQGGRNTTYFQNSGFKRRRKNRISVILDHNNNTIQNPDETTSCFIIYLINLFTSCNTKLGTLQEVMDDGPSIPNKDEIL